MYAVIIAGGKGTRVASVNNHVPKPMLPINGKPVLEHQIACLKQQGITHITLTIGYLGEQIHNYFGDGSRFDVKIDYLWEHVPLGTAGALYELKGHMQDDFLLINGDLIFDVDMHRLMKFHQDHHAMATLLVHPNDHPYDSGLIVAETDGCVIDWLTKEDERGYYRNCVNAGIHIISPRLLDQIPAHHKTDLDRDLLRPQISLGTVYAYRSPEYVKDMGTPDRISAVERDLANGLVRKKNLSQSQRAIFLDRDGTINHYVGFLHRLEEFKLLDDVAEAICSINRSGYLVIVVTNQPVIARGEVSWMQLDEIHRKMETLLGEKGAYIDDVFICPHHPDRGFVGEIPEYKVDCDCRKPKPGMLLQAAKKYHIDLTKSWMIGDSASDDVAGLAAGCRTMTVSNVFSLYDAIEHIRHEEEWNT